MRQRTLAHSFLSLLLLLTTFHFAAQRARAADDNDDKHADDNGYEETARVARVSLLAGDVSLRRAGSNKWERAALNTPLVEGDRLATGSASRVEIQIDSRNFIRVGEYSTVDVVTLRDAGVALSLPEGTATLRLARFDHAHEYFEIDAPGTTVAAEGPGLYRLDVDKDGKVRVSVRESGRARLYSESSGFTLRDGRTASMVNVGSSDEADWEFSDVRPFDSWDTWVDERERYLLARLNYENRDRYYDSQVYGAEELDAYGDWVQTHDYGYVWRPRAAVINIYNNWAPYRYGHWDWCPPYGWVWVGDEAWGWAPYHYGRWVYADNYWCWAPRGYYGYNYRAWWRPALVAFVNVHVSFGDNVCWYPLPYHHSDPHSNFWRHLRDRERLDARRRDELSNLQRLNPIYRHAVSGLPKNDFSRGGVRPHPADPELAKLALATDPVRGRLPVRPFESVGGEANLRERLSADKRAALGSRNDGATVNDPMRHTLERPTGASKRLPGVALDDELRRARILNNREPVSKGLKGEARGDASDPMRHTSGDPDRRTIGDPDRRNVGDPDRRNVGGDLERRGDATDRRDGDTRTTGAVSRPARPIRINPDGNGTKGPGGEKAGGDKSGGDKSDGEKSGGEKGAGDDPRRTTRPVRTNPEGGDTRGRNGDDTLDRRKNTDERERIERERSAPREERRDQPVERREQPQERRTEPAPRYERPEPRREERPSPPPREERQSPPPREERSSPPPKSESKSEERHSEPAHEKSEPSRGRPPQGK
ncbi:MAG: hypothetical protein QOE33_1611 [Acidobacteriota bacterium]|nr:hypothetical protein [Acidobacteriota bacterium]